MKGLAPKIDIVSTPINIGKTSLMLLKLRAKWIDAFLDRVLSLNPEIPRDVATTWVDFYFPNTVDELAASLSAGVPEKLAFRLADAWDAA